jgi:PAS domain S-box-containing protein
MLGGRARDHWQEIWPIIGPQIDLVLRGDGATWHENQLVPMDRHGRRDDVYWTYSYSPIDDASAPHGVGGVMVLCTETTSQVLESERRRAAELRWQALFEQAPGFMCVLAGPCHRFEYANARYKELVGRADIVGRTVEDTLPEVVAQGFVALLDHVYRTGEAHRASAVPIRLAADGDRALRQYYLDYVFQPMREAGGAIVGILVTGHDVTERVTAERRTRENQAQFVALADSVPALAWTTTADGRSTT